MPSDRPLDDRGFALHQVEGAPAGECSGEGVVSLQSLQDPSGRLADLSEAAVLAEGDEASQVLLDGEGLGGSMAVACAVEALQEEDAAEKVPFGGDFSSRCSTSEDGLDERGLLGSHLSGLAYPLEVCSRVVLDELHLAQLHLVVGIAQQPEVALLSEEAAQVLLDRHGVLFLEEASLLLLREEHPNVALDVYYDQLQFHMHDYFAGTVSSVSPLDHASGQYLHVECLNQQNSAAPDLMSCLTALGSRTLTEDDFAASTLLKVVGTIC